LIKQGNKVGENNKTDLTGIGEAYNKHDGLVHVKNGRIIDPNDGHEVDNYSAEMEGPAVAVVH